MKRLIILPLLISAVSPYADAGVDPSCRGCASGKLMLQCDHYVVKQGKMEMRSACEKYAEIVDVDGASAKAAWYYLLAGKVGKAHDAAKRAIELGQVFANEYMAYALLIQGKEKEAEEAMQLFRKGVAQHSFFKTDIASLQQFYPNVDFSILAD